MPTNEREITEPVDLCLPDGRLAPGAVGWSRRPLHRTGMRGWGRTKRWEYWCVTTPTHLLALTVSDLDYLAVNTVHFLEYGPSAGAVASGSGSWAAGREVERTAVVPCARGVRLPDAVAGSPGPSGAPGGDVVVGPGRPVRGQVRIEIRQEARGTRLRARCLTPDGQQLEADLLVGAPEGHESMNVVVPWSARRFQYTSKQTARPATGHVRIGERVHTFADDAWGTLDHGRGRWPRAVTWNWGAASGRSGGHTLGLQFGGRWTEGTGATENALCVDGRLSKIGEELEWTYSGEDFMAPWTVRTPHSGQVDLTFTPFHDRRTRTNAGLLANRTDQCFGHWSGLVRSDAGEEIPVDGVLGWAEEVHMRW